MSEFEVTLLGTYTTREVRTMPTCDGCAQVLLDGGGHPEGRCNHWLCSECQLEYTGPVFCPCGIDLEDDEDLGRPTPAFAPTTPEPTTRAGRTPAPPTVMRPTRLSFV